jgi:hypothetical protein
MDKDTLERIFSADVPTFDHFSACGHLAAHVGRIVPGRRLLEIGTGYGLQIPHVMGHFDHTLCIDVMYDWVPDILPDSPFDPSLVDQKKMDSWRNACRGLEDRVTLVLGNTYHVCRDTPELISEHGPYDVMIVDGCHHPASAVELDFWNHVPFMADSFFAVFDDVNEYAPAHARDNVEKKLRETREVRRRDWQKGHIGATLLYVGPTTRP